MNIIKTDNIEHNLINLDRVENIFLGERREQSHIGFNYSSGTVYWYFDEEEERNDTLNKLIIEGKVKNWLIGY